MIEQAQMIAKGLWEANQELAEEIAHEIYELRDEEPEIIKKCESSKFQNLPSTGEVYGTESDFWSNLWEK